MATMKVNTKTFLYVSPKDNELLKAKVVSMCSEV